MILVKTVIDNKLYYKPVSEKEAENYDGSDLLYVEENIEEDNEEGVEYTDGNIILKSVGKSLGVEGLIKKAGAVFDFFKAEYQDINHDIVAMLPFLNEEDIHKCVMSIIDEDKNISAKKVVAMLPFMSQSDCDRLFEHYLNNPEYYHKLTIMGPFVSSECLSKLVDDYVSGKYDESLKLSTLYPFMDSADVKKLFIYCTSR